MGLTAAPGRVQRRYESVTAGSFPEASGLSRRQPCFPAVILRFCCRAAVDRPRAASRLTVSLTSPDDQAARANSCFSAVICVAPFNESEQLGSHARSTKLMSNPISPVDVATDEDTRLGLLLHALLLTTERAGHLALGVALGEGGAPVLATPAPGQGELHLRPAVLEVQGERHQRQSFLRHARP